MSDRLMGKKADAILHVQVPLSDLRLGSWYVGRGRNGNVGLWDGTDFRVIARVGIKTGPGPRDWTTEWGIKREPYYGETEGCFQPFCRIDEGQIVEPFGELGWDAHYGRSLLLGN
ncbi:hypothetical protein PA01_06115 [Azoarcus sp. PA01]|nr:hypothetical protein PA01_06115 [Azoarcus sp. PA01]